jgi:hypothetical protein
MSQTVKHLFVVAHDLDYLNEYDGSLIDIFLSRADAEEEARYYDSSGDKTIVEFQRVIDPPVIEKKGIDEFPQVCKLCGQKIGSRLDFDYHGLGDCVSICSRCYGSGIEPNDSLSKSSTEKI